MDEMLSGFVGALIATILSVVYLYIAEQIRHRTEIALEVVGHCDEIFNRLQFMHIHKEKAYTQTDTELNPEVYRANSIELAALIQSTKTHAKLEIVYGAGTTVAAMNGLSHHFQEASSMLWGATKNDWAEKGVQVQNLFKNVIDPMRAGLQRELIDGTRVKGIIKHFIAGFWKKVT